MTLVAIACDKQVSTGKDCYRPALKITPILVEKLAQVKATKQLPIREIPGVIDIRLIFSFLEKLVF